MVERLLALARAERLERVFLLTTTAGGFFRRFGFRPVRREDVPAALRATEEFAGACPASATIMRLDLSRPRAPRKKKAA